MSSILRYLRICVFRCQTSHKLRHFFDDFTESSSFSCEKTTVKISGPANGLFATLEGNALAEMFLLV